MSETKNVLRVENVTMQFGGVVAVDDLSMEVNEGEIVALIGPNGAGKTTAFNVITGVYAPTNGQVLFDGKKVVENHPRGKMRRQYKGKHLGDYKSVLEPTPDKLTRMGMARTFQNIRLWKSMTVFDNVLIAKHLRRSSNMFTAMFRLNAREEARQRAEVLELLRVVGLEDVKDELATSLPYGKQLREKNHAVHGKGAAPEIGSLACGGVGLRVMLQVPDQRGARSFQRDDQKNLRQPQRCLCGKQAAAVLQGIQQFGRTAFDFHIPKPACQNRHGQRH